MRGPLALFLIATAYGIGGVFTQVLLLPLHRTTPALVLAPMLMIVLGSVYVVKKLNEPRDPPDPTPPQCWKAGFFYYNREDAALMVEKRSGAGMTVNFGNPWSWVLCGFLFANLATLLLLRFYK